MARDNKKNGAYESGLRGKEKPRGSGGTEPTMSHGTTSVSVRRADNGYIVSCEYPPKKGKEFYWTPPSQHVFATAADVAKFIEEVLGVKEKKED